LNGKSIVATSPSDLRRDLALANRILERFRLSGAFGHASARIPGTQTFLLPASRSPALAAGDRMLVLDTGGRILSGEGAPDEEFWLHARLYAARPDLGGVVYAHAPSCIALAQIGQLHRILHNAGGTFHGGVPQFERIGPIRTLELGDLLAQRLGGGVAVMLRGQGIATAAADTRAATVAACLLEESADLALRMLAAAGGDGARMRTYTQEEIARVRDQLDPGVVARAWEYYAAAAQQPAGTASD
jgi:ribulose-5-phosphate 4-epimerase/fuculose-1-phosphate aldolase